MTLGLPRVAAGRGALLAAISLTAAALGAVLTGPELGYLNRGVESASGASGSLVGSLATIVPLGYAFGAGMVAAMNPCGFALLPAYMALQVQPQGLPAAARGVGAPLRQSLLAGGAMVAGVVVVFSVVGVAVGLAASAIARYFPWLGLALGVLMVVMAGQMLMGFHPYTRMGDLLADRFGVQARSRSLRGSFFFGLAFAAASLSCTLPIFLAIVGNALTVSGFFGALLQVVLYACGMAAIIAFLIVGASLVGTAVLAGGRKLTRYVEPVGAMLLMVAGTYVVYYWLTLGGLLAEIGSAFGWL